MKIDILGIQSPRCLKFTLPGISPTIHTLFLNSMVWLLATQAWHQNSAGNQEQIKNSILNQSRDGKSDPEGGSANPIVVIWAKRTKSD